MQWADSNKERVIALSDYRLCDQCDGKAFYDANLNYDTENLNKKGDWKLDYVGDMAVLCDDCAERYGVVIQPKSTTRSAG